MHMIAQRLDPVQTEGSILSVSDTGIVVDDCLGMLSINARVEIETSLGSVLADVVSVGERSATVMPFGSRNGIKRGDPVKFLSAGRQIAPSPAWLGRVVNGLGHPVDEKGPLVRGNLNYSLDAAPPPPALRARLGSPVDFGIKALSVFTPTRAGQRLGLFSGAGVGKSALLGMIARNTECDVVVLAMIGERGREVREFIEDVLGEERLARSVVVVASSDEPAMMRREAAFMAITIAEYFRDQGLHVLCLMDSLTRLAMAQREISLASGEPPATKGYTPSVFSMLPALVERAGPGRDGANGGCITGIYTVLVEGDDHDEPIADATRAILDGHIVLDRKVSERGRFPAIDVLRSVSRSMPGAVNEDQNEMIKAVKSHIATYDDMQELIRIGAYRAGSNEDVDRAIALHPHIEDFLSQEITSECSIDEAFAVIADILARAT